MEFLFSNFPPIRTANKTFADAFYGLIPQTSKLDIAVGYVSSDTYSVFSISSSDNSQKSFKNASYIIVSSVGNV